MSGLSVETVTLRARLDCGRCGATWRSGVVSNTGYSVPYVAAVPAFVMGWRVFSASRSQRAYCPDCEPSVPMHLVYGPGRLPR